MWLVLLARNSIGICHSVYSFQKYLASWYLRVNHYVGCVAVTLLPERVSDVFQDLQVFRIQHHWALSVPFGFHVMAVRTSLNDQRRNVISTHYSK